MRYNGSVNWETWNVGAHLDNTESIYNQVQRMTSEDEVREFVEQEFKRSGKFGDINTQEEFDRIDWAEVWEVVSAE